MKLDNWLLMLLWLGALCGSCAVYNDACPVSGAQVWGDLTVDLDIREDFVTQCETPAGNFLADALLNYGAYGVVDPDTMVPATVRIAVIDPAAIRDEVRCGDLVESRTTIPAGPITDQDVLQFLPAGASVILVKMSGARVKEVLERAVSGLAEGDPADERLLLQFSSQKADIGGQIVGNHVVVNCLGTAQQLAPDGRTIQVPGSRIQEIQVGQSSITPLDLGGTFYVATLDVMIPGGDDPHKGFTAFRQDDVLVAETHVPLTAAVHSWLQSYREHPLYSDSGYPSAEGRLELNSCAEISICGSE